MISSINAYRDREHRIFGGVVSPNRFSNVGRHNSQVCCIGH